MAKRLQVVLKDAEYRAIQRAARSRHMSIAEWVRRALVSARRQEPAGSIGKKLESIHIAAQHEFPAGEIESMCAEIEAGYGATVRRVAGEHSSLQHVLDEVGRKTQARRLTREMLDSILRDGSRS
jgi:hypothetical protein